MKHIFTALTLLVSMGISSAAMAEQAASRDLAREEANRQLVVHFYDQFFNQHDTVDAAKVVADNYRQHNPEVPDGKAPFVGYFTDFFKHNPHSGARIVRSAADGDLVYLHIHSYTSKNDRGQAIVDIFRVKDGKITEHWDVIQNIPEKSANNNTMF